LIPKSRSGIPDVFPFAVLSASDPLAAVDVSILPDDATEAVTIVIKELSDVLIRIFNDFCADAISFQL
jgi:hypothetical protein